jgi:cytoskeletal protein RodZ
MTKEKKEPVENKEEEDVSINTEELKENLAKQSKWLRLLWMVAFSFVYYVAIGILWLIVVTQFLFSLFTNSPNENILKLSNGFRNYMVQILDFITYQSDEKPFPFSDFPKSKK